VTVKSRKRFLNEEDDIGINIDQLGELRKSMTSPMNEIKEAKRTKPKNDFLGQASNGSDFI